MNDSGRPVVVPDQPAESSVTFDLTSCCLRTAVQDQLVPNSLMRSFMVIMLDVLADQVVKMFPANGDEVIEAFNFERFDPPLDVCIHQGCLDRQRVWFHTFAEKCFVELPRVEHIIVSHKNGGRLQSKLLHVVDRN